MSDSHSYAPRYLITVESLWEGQRLCITDTYVTDLYASKIIATCATEENAKLVCSALNLCEGIAKIYETFEPNE